LSSSVEVKEIATPLNDGEIYWHYKGAIYGWSQVLSQSSYKRLGNVTPIRNLFLASGWTIPGGGICSSMLSGMSTAKIILRKNLSLGRHYAT